MKKTSIGIVAVYALFLNPVICGKFLYLCYAVVYGVPLLYMILNARLLMSLFYGLKKRYAISLMGIMVLMAVCIIVPIVHGTYDYSYTNVVLGIIRKAIIVLFLFLVILKRYGRSANVEIFMYYYSIAMCCYVIGTILFTLILPLKSFWITFLNLDEGTLEMLSTYGYVVRFGWSGFSGFRQTIDCAFAGIFTIYLYMSPQSKINISEKRFIPMFLFSFLGNMFYGRIGFVVAVLCLFVALLLYHKINLKMILGGGGALFAAVMVVVVLKERIPVIQDWYNWLSTPFINLFTKGRFDNYSADMLLHDMIFRPSNRTLLFGDGWYTDIQGNYYLHTDAGFMRQILFWGLGFTLLTYMLWLISLFSINKDKALVLMLLIASIIFEIKGECYYELFPFFMLLGIFNDKTRQDFKVLNMNLNLIGG